MSENNNTYRIRTDIGDKLNVDYITLDTNLLQDYDTFDILSLKIDSVDTYKLHNANYGVVVGRVLANNGFGIPNAKISIFIEADSEDGAKVNDLYPFTSTFSKNRKGVRYNLLPDEKVSDCHQVVGTFPNKRYALDNDVILEVFDKYYKYTTRTNNSGDYLIMGVPVGNHTRHMDLDLSDCGILSQKPRDFVYKGYTIEQFENPNMFKEGTIYSELSQIFTQDQVVNVQPFWGNTSNGDKIGITRADIDVAFKFQPTCVFMGSVISDNSSQGISKKWQRRDLPDMFQKSLEHVGQVAVAKREIAKTYETDGSSPGYLEGEDGMTFAFSDPYYEYKMGLDILAGDFMKYHASESENDTTLYMQSMEQYIDFPAGREFTADNLKVDGDSFNKIFYYLGGSVDEDVDDHFHLCIDKDVLINRPMEGYAIPTLETTQNPHESKTQLSADKML